VKSEPLSIRDTKFLINRLIQQAPVHTLVREFFKNADESAALAPDGQRQIHIYPTVVDGVRKLTFWNTGPGMDDTELKAATELSSSINKTMSLEDNFGIGAKVSGLTMSRNGIRYRSCKNGTVSQVTIGYHEDAETYVRFSVQFDDGQSDTVIDVTEHVTQLGGDTSTDWTEVVLFGESDDHDTVAEPLGKGKSVDRSFIPSAIFRRFASFSPGVEVRVDVAMTKGGGKDETGRTRQLKTLEQIITNLPRAERITDEESGVTVHYVHDPKHPNSSHSMSSRINSATSSTTFCALVHKGERYDLKTQQSWAAAAPKFGITFGSKVLTVEIEIPDAMALPNQYRDGLTWPIDRSAITAEELAFFVRELMPDWVKQVVRDESPQADDNLDDLRNTLQKLLDDFRVPTVVMNPSTREAALQAERHEDGSDTPERADLNTDFSVERNYDGPTELQGRGTDRASSDKVRKAPEGSKPSRQSQALERVPEITILVEPDDVAEKGLTGRAGCYYGESQTLFVNGLYPIVDRMADQLAGELNDLAEPEIVREKALLAARRSVAFRVGKAACYAISKRILDDWTNDDLNKATTPESLSMAADDYHQSMPEARRWAKGMIKAASTQATDAA